jgi:hypothetical protein
MFGPVKREKIILNSILDFSNYERPTIYLNESNNADLLSILYNHATLYIPTFITKPFIWFIKVFNFQTVGMKP